MTKPKRVAIIIPCFNEADSVEALLEEIRCAPVSEAYHLYPIFINDCSTDTTRDILARIGAQYLDLPVNLGIGGAVQTGFRYAYAQGFDMAIQLDGDGQHPPSELSKLIEPLLNDAADVVIGSRFMTGEGFQSSSLRRAGIGYFKRLNRLLVHTTVYDSTSGFRAINVKTLAIVSDYYPDEYPEPEAIVLYALNNLRIHEVPVSMRERQGGQSSIRAFKTVYYMAKVTLGCLFLYIRLRSNGKRLTR